MKQLYESGDYIDGVYLTATEEGIVLKVNKTLTIEDVVLFTWDKLKQIEEGVNNGGTGAAEGR